MNRKDSKTVHEAFARFFEAPSRESLRTLLKEHVGELRNCDFKAEWPENSALSKHILGIGNAGGGCLIFGVKENDDKSTTPQGLPEFKDKADLANGLKAYLSEPLLNSIETADFKYEASEYAALVGKIFQVIFIHARPESLPFVAQRGGTGIRAGSIYVRREGQTEEATYEEVQRVISDRLAAAPQTLEARNLKEHLEELKVLFSEIPKNLSSPGLVFAPISKDMERIARMFAGNLLPNPQYPKEDYQTFVAGLIVRKKRLIESLLSVAIEV